MEKKPTFDLDSNPLGHSYGYWTGKWWEFVLSQGVDGRPFSQNKPENSVYFFGTPFGNVEETPIYGSEIPEKKPSLFAVANHLVYSHRDGIESLHDRANRYINSVTHRIATITEFRGESQNVTPLVPVRAYTVVNGIKHTEKFRNEKHDTTEDIKTDEIDEKAILNAAADGYWIFFKGLPKGEYEVRTYAEMDDHLKPGTRFTPQQHTKLTVT